MGFAFSQPLVTVVLEDSEEVVPKDKHRTHNHDVDEKLNHFFRLGARPDHLRAFSVRSSLPAQRTGGQARALCVTQERRGHPEDC